MQRGLNFFLLWILGFTVGYAAQPEPWQLNFQPAASPVMERIHSMHHILLVLMVVVAVIVFALLFYVIYRFRAHRNPMPASFSFILKI
ncbi:MAG: cytochrome c oxidase subunit II transmembrane domain-containing protein [Holosporales bacterium]